MTPNKIRAARLAVGLTQARAAALIYRDRITWWRYESGDLTMPPELWELFRLKVERR